MTIHNTDNKMTWVAHRGIATQFPENTMLAFKAALSKNIDILEIDVHRTLDNYLVVIHDNTIDRTSNGTGKVKDMTLQQLQQFDYGITKDTKYTGQIIPTLDEVLKLLTVHSQKLLIELKQPHDYPGIEEELIDKLNILQIAKDKVIIQSFNQNSMKKIFELDEGYELGVLISRRKYWYKQPAFKKIATYAKYINPHYKLVTKRFVNKAHRYKLKVMPYTINERPQSKALEKLGIDGIISDNPNVLM